MNKITERLKRLVAGMEDRHAFKLESAILKFTRLLRERMERVDVSPTELAKRIEAKPPYISKILRGKSNFTFDSVIKLCSAVDADFVFDVVPKNQKANWISIETKSITLQSQANVGPSVISNARWKSTIYDHATSVPMSKRLSYELS